MEQRRNAIVELVNREGSLSFVQLKEAFPSVSEMTLRTDLKALDQARRVVRVHGGVKSVEVVVGTDDQFGRRTARNASEKQIIAEKAAALLREIGILTADGKLKNDMIRKYNQIDHYVELVAPMFEQDDSDEIVLLDCACGKPYLSFVMNYYLHEVLHRRCRVIGVDIKEHVIDESRAMAKRLGYHNMSFQCADLRVYQPPKNVTAVISLHACDIATDLALATALRARAKYIACVPCCHKELLDQYTMPGLEPLTRHGVFKARFNDVLTDSMRALKLEAEGYKVSVVEYISPLDTPKNLLIRAVRTGRENRRAKADYEAVRRTLGTTSELDRRCMDMENEFFVTDEDLIP